METVLSFNGASLNVYFKTLQPLEFKEDVVAPSDIVEESTGVESSGFGFSADVSDEVLNGMFEALNEFGEDEDLDEWELVDERPVDYEQEEYLDSILKSNFFPEAISDLSFSFIPDGFAFCSPYHEKVQFKDIKTLQKVFEFPIENKSRTGFEQLKAQEKIGFEVVEVEISDVPSLVS